MHQFGVYRNRNAATKARYPLLLNIQSDLIAESGTRVVVPLLPARRDRASLVMAGLTPEMDINGQAHVLVVPLLAAIDASDLGPLEADLSPARATIMAALDLLISGI